MGMNDVSHKTQQAMETAMAGAAEVGRYGRRIAKYLWDPKPTNDRASNRPVWCLGHSYTHDTKMRATSEPAATEPAKSDTSSSPSGTDPATPAATAPTTPPDSIESSFSSSLAYDETDKDDGWPQAFLDDFESRIWMTYRSAFEPISRSSDPKATAALSFTMRLKSLADQQSGFSSDTGWGCMIRSGQSLLANTLSICDLGRGEFLRVTSGALASFLSCGVAHQELGQIGAVAWMTDENARSWLVSPMILAPPIPFITSSDMVPLPVVNTQESGSGHLRQPAVYSEYQYCPPFIGAMD